jgi:REP element-mobilizing transposase RayT
LYAYIGGIVRGEKGKLLSIGGTSDHVHLLVLLSPVLAVSQMLQRMKGNSSRWVNDRQGQRGAFRWQRGYGAFSVSESMRDRVARYVENQKKHHRKQGFQEEFRALLKKHNVKYDERYVWD